MKKAQVAVAACLLLLALGVAAPLALAFDDFGASNLAGRYAFQLTGGATIDPTAPDGYGTQSILGVFTADGAGNVEGSRTLFRTGRRGPGPVYEAMEQSFTGTYSVGADGRGRIDIQVLRRAVWFPSEVAGTDLKFTPGIDEAIHFVVVEGGRRLLLTGVSGGEGEIDNCGELMRGRLSFFLSGRAERQDSPEREGVLRQRLTLAGPVFNQ